MSFHKAKYVFISNLKPDYFAGFPGFYMSAREGIKGGEITNGQHLIMTLLGPKGIKEKLVNSFCFMGRLRFLRPIEFTNEDANLEEQKFSVRSLLEVTGENDAKKDIIEEMK